MSDPRTLLAAWLSPSYPVGAFSYSHGLETAIAEGDVVDRESLTAWIEDCLTLGAGRTDAILLAAAYHAPEDEEIAVLARALAPSAERALETEAQGSAFAETTAAVWGPACDPPLASALASALDPPPYPVAVGRAAAAHGVPLEDALPLYLHAFVANLASVGVRLIPIGQTDGQRVAAALMGRCVEVSAEAATASLDDIGGCAVRADIASMRHETQEVRLFRS